MARNKSKPGNSIQILECLDCGRKVVAVGDQNGSVRINHHKCSGAWETILEVPLSPTEWAELIEESAPYAEAAT